MEKIKRKKETVRAFKYLFFTASAGIVQIASFTLLNEAFHMQYWAAYFIGLTLSVIWNFTFNRKFTFKSVANIPLAMLKVIAYYAVFTPLSIWWGNALTAAGWNEYLILAFTMIINFITEFAFYTFVVFRHSIDSAANAKKNEEENLEEPTAPEIEKEEKNSEKTI
ncbi:MAG: GtrA family protein [Clostridia bacterium]